MPGRLAGEFHDAHGLEWPVKRALDRLQDVLDSSGNRQRGRIQEAVFAGGADDVQQLLYRDRAKVARRQVASRIVPALHEQAAVLQGVENRRHAMARYLQCLT
ncbi:hypothetical protein [Accumulibacter sp.]|uniref:hypothetical protein n=1 Tax=Candidatus Accumulibacter TaxID=327159 RepID=UPI0018FF819A|nr:hypothetical protein [Accumulibacter sp.]MBN8497812.1 hypothetical protein [Accumulibacter sp.]MBO3714555.1 hypothetical protein [Accumulibacter sp.]